MGVPLCGGLTFFWYANVMLSITFAVGNILYVNDLTILIVIGLYCCSFIWQIWALNMLSKSFGRDEGITAGLFCLPVVFIPVIAFDRRVKYLGPYGDPELFRAYSAEDAGFDFEKDKFNA